MNKFWFCCLLLLLYLRFFNFLSFVCLFVCLYGQIIHLEIFNFRKKNHNSLNFRNFILFSLRTPTHTNTNIKKKRKKEIIVNTHTLKKKGGDEHRYIIYYIMFDD